MAAGHRYITLARTAQKTSFATFALLLRVTQSLPSNGCSFGSTVLALSKYATVLSEISRLCIVKNYTYNN
jgi:hypothetical protein